MRARDQSPPIDDGQHDPRAQSDRCPCGAPGAGRPNRRAGSRAGRAPAGRRCRRRCRRRRLDSRRALPRRSRSRAPATRSRRPAQSRPRRGPERPTWLAIRSPLRSSTTPASSVTPPARAKPATAIDLDASGLALTITLPGRFAVRTQSWPPRHYASSPANSATTVAAGPWRRRPVKGEARRAGESAAACPMFGPRQPR